MHELTISSSERVTWKRPCLVRVYALSTPTTRTINSEPFHSDRWYKAVKQNYLGDTVCTSSRTSVGCHASCMYRSHTPHTAPSLHLHCRVISHMCLEHTHTHFISLRQLNMWLYLNKAISCGFWWLTGLKLLQKFSFMRLTSFTIQTTEVAVFVLICRAVGLPPCSAVSHFKTSLWVCCGGFEENDQDRHKNLWIWMWGLKKNNNK